MLREIRKEDKWEGRVKGMNERRTERKNKGKKER